MTLDLTKNDTAIIEEAFTINDALGIDDIESIREAMRANYSAPEDFPAVARKGLYAYMTFDDGQVLRCPALDGSDDFALNAFAWLKMVWPFRVTSSGKLVKTVRRLDGRESNLQLHELYARFAHQHLDFDFRNLEAVNGDWLDWSPKNIRPVKDPDAPASAKEKKKAALSDNAVREFQRFIRVTPLLPDEKKIALSTDFVRWRERAVANLKQPAVDAKRFEEHQTFDLPCPELVVDERGPAPPARSVSTDSTAFDENDENGWATLYENHDAGITDADTTFENKPEWNECADEITATVKSSEPMFTPKTYSSLDYYNLDLETFRASLANDSSLDHRLETERVLRFFGWRTPDNDHLPTYEGRLKVMPWPRLIITSKLVTIQHKLLILQHLISNEIGIPQLVQ